MSTLTDSEIAAVRESFEAWAHENGCAQQYFMDSLNDGYGSPYIQMRWIGFLAAAERYMPRPAPSPADEAEEIAAFEEMIERDLRKPPPPFKRRFENIHLDYMLQGWRAGRKLMREGK